MATSPSAHTEVRLKSLGRPHLVDASNLGQEIIDALSNIYTLYNFSGVSH